MEEKKKQRKQKSKGNNDITQGAIQGTKECTEKGDRNSKTQRAREAKEGEPKGVTQERQAGATESEREGQGEAVA